jgi:hypothetical protein
MTSIKRPRVEVGVEYPIRVAKLPGVAAGAEGKGEELAVLHFSFLPESVRQCEAAEVSLDASGADSGKAISREAKLVLRRESGQAVNFKGTVLTAKGGSSSRAEGATITVGGMDVGHVLQFDGAAFVVRPVELAVTHLQEDRGVESMRMDASEAGGMDLKRRQSELKAGGPSKKGAKKPKKLKVGAEKE